MFVESLKISVVDDSKFSLSKWYSFHGISNKKSARVVTQIRLAPELPLADFNILFCTA